MKYLKKFNESMTEHEVQEWVEETLVELIDSGFFVAGNIQQTRQGNFVIIHIRKVYPKHEDFKWEEVKDKVLPLLEIAEEWGIRSIHAKQYSNDDVTDITNFRDIDDKMEISLLNIHTNMPQ